MNIKLILLLTLFCLILNMNNVSALVNITLNTTIDDTYVYGSSKDTNYGSSSNFNINSDNCFGGFCFQRAYLKFDISSLPIGVTLISVKLRASLTQIGNPLYVNIGWIYNQTWEEQELTWNNQPCNNLTWNPTNSSQCITDNPYSNNSHTTTNWQTFYLGVSGLEHLQNHYNLSSENISYIFWEIPYSDDGFGHYHRFNSKENNFYSELIIEINAETLVTLNTPLNDTWYDYNEIIFNATGYDTGSGLKNSSLWFNCNDLAWHLNQSNIHSNETQIDSIFTVNISDTSNCSWNVKFCDVGDNGNISNCDFADNNFTLKIDATPPEIYYIPPTPNIDVDIEPFTQQIINVSVNDSLNLVDTVIIEFITPLETINTTGNLYITDALSVGFYEYRTYANDTLGNSIISPTRNFTVRFNMTFTFIIENSENIEITNSSCLNNETLYREWSEYKCIQGICLPLMKYQIKHCPFGCVEELSEIGSNCLQPDWQIYIYGIIAIIIILLVALYFNKQR